MLQACAAVRQLALSMLCTVCLLRLKHVVQAMRAERAVHAVRALHAVLALCAVHTGQLTSSQAGSISGGLGASPG